ncbi:hypothetical protein C5E44_31755 [Nocardia nova]|nr:hypothetical protein C5E44_31755 [Nocardia nova]
MSLGAVAAPIASADSASDTTAKPIAICITIPLPGSADLGVVLLNRGPAVRIETGNDCGADRYAGRRHMRG